MTKITKLTKTSNLVLLTILIGVSVTSAYAITITLAADPVNVQGNLNVNGNLDVTSVTAEDYTFTNPQTRKFVIGSIEFNADAPISYSNRVGAFFTSGLNPTMFGAIHIPVGASIKQLDCIVLDNHATRNVSCDLLSYQTGFAPNFQAGSVSTGQNSLVQTISTGAISVTTNSVTNYFVTFSPTDADCGIDCRLFQATITYEVSTAD